MYNILSRGRRFFYSAAQVSCRDSQIRNSETLPNYVCRDYLCGTANIRSIFQKRKFVSDYFLLHLKKLAYLNLITRKSFLLSMMTPSALSLRALRAPFHNRYFSRRGRSGRMRGRMNGVYEP